ncbi:hypothetical protein [Blastomonas sp. UPD001]|uniref:hypothetical protein n=1 Tax=Blastomonas sp. UPD001 TaxID=2217673 RepID=UPI001E5B3789|nr:hypothetical protein [Blastomonas sp. UPD001]
MSVLAQAMLAIFIAAAVVAIGGWAYGTRYWLPMWAAGFRKTEWRSLYMRRAIKGYSGFILAVGIGFAVGGIAEYWGGGW